MFKIPACMKDKKISIPLPYSILLLFLSSLFITLVMFYLSPGSGKAFLLVLAENSSLFFLNYIPVLLLFLLLFFVFNNAVLSISLSSTLFVSLSIINRVKIQMRQDPLLPTDISLVTEITAILDKFNTSFVLTVIAIIILAILVILLSVLFFKGSRLNPYFRIGAVALLLLSGFLINKAVYSDEARYDSYGVEGNYYFKVNHYISKGFTYSFLNDFNSRKVKKPIGYDEVIYEALEDSNDAADFNNYKKPNIIMIMGEAFSDLSENPNIDFNGYTDPMENFKKIAQEPGAVSGHIVVPSFGGGTSDTEFDVLSGCPTKFIDNDLPSYSFINKSFDALPMRLKSIGYDTLAVHPGYPWFYNRANVYPYMGFDDFIHLENGFDEKTQSVSGFISDDAVMDKLIAEFENHKVQSEDPFFEFCVTIQNHGPFTDKYGIKQSFNTDKTLDAEQMNKFSNYFKGVSDGDAALEKLVSYFRDSEDPMVIVYFGDHLPGFPGGTEMLAALDYNMNIDGNVEQRLNLYKTPYLIWQNEAARELTDFEDGKDKLLLPEDNVINASFLGATVFEILGFDGLSPLFDFLNELRKELPVITNQGYMDKNSVYTETVSKEQTDEIDLLKGWVYFKLFDETIAIR